jgi:uncharacterized membrane protein
MTSDHAEARARLRLFFPPITLILVSIPLILKMVPRNQIYGFRTHEAMASDAAWYPANRLGGIALIGASLIWLAAATYAPRRYVTAIGVAAVLLIIGLLVVSQGWSV